MPVSYEPDTNEQVLFEEIESRQRGQGVWERKQVFIESFSAESKEDYRSPFVASKSQKPIEHFAEAHFSDAIIIKAKEFFRDRMSNNRNEARNPRTPLLDHRPVAHEAGLTSKAASSGGFQANGLAILDTGASRSVIGEDNIPSLMEQLLKPVRSRAE